MDAGRQAIFLARLSGGVTCYVSRWPLPVVPAVAQSPRLRGKRLHRAGAGGPAGPPCAGASTHRAPCPKARPTAGLVDAVPGRADDRTSTGIAAIASGADSAGRRRFQLLIAGRHAGTFAPGQSAASVSPVFRNKLRL